MLSFLLLIRIVGGICKRGQPHRPGSALPLRSSLLFGGSFSRSETVALAPTTSKQCSIDGMQEPRETF